MIKPSIVKRKGKGLAAAVSVMLLFAGVGVGTLFAQLNPEAGFTELNELDFYVHQGSYFNRLQLRSSPARIWHVFQPADERPEDKPLFVFFNGGPGGATSAGLFSANTGRKAVRVDYTNGTSAVIDNPSSWTRMGNLLHIDARTAGFSYSLMDDPGNDTLRLGEWDAQNYNPFIDGADFVRVLLRFLDNHPEIQANRVIFVPESYGGIRTTCILHFLLYYRSYADGTEIFQSPQLVEEIQNHYDAVFPIFQGHKVDPFVVATQFSHQVMIQVALSRTEQRQIAVEMLEAPGSLLDKLAEETGVPFLRWHEIPGNTWTPSPYQVMRNIYDYLDRIKRDPYIFKEAEGYFNGFFEAAADLLTQYPKLCEMIGMDAASIPHLYASSRQRAYKSKNIWFDTPPLSALEDPPLEKRCLEAMREKEAEFDMIDIFGQLQPWDRYFLDLNHDVSLTFALNKAEFHGYQLYYSRNAVYGRMFLENTAWVNTFITNAEYDVVVYSPAIPRALSLFTDIITRAEHDKAGPLEADRPGQIHLSYRHNGVPDSTVTERTIRFPHYKESGHAVTLTEHGEMLIDVWEWLQETGVHEVGPHAIKKWKGLDNGGEDKTISKTCSVGKVDGNKSSSSEDLTGGSQ